MKEEQKIPAGYKPSPLGPIPEDWEVKRLKELGDILSGTTPSRKNEKYYINGSIPWVKTLDLTNGVISETEEYITEIALKECSLQIFPKGTILVAMYGGFRQIGRTGILAMEATVNQAISGILLKKDISQYYILQYLNENVKRWKKYAASSRKDPNITGSDVSNFLIAHPPISEQRKIAEILSTWDKSIELQTVLIEKLTLRKKGLMQQLLTGKKRLKGFSEPWSFIKAGEIFRSSSARGTGQEELLSATQENGVMPRKMLEGRVTMPSGATNSFKLVEKGDFVISLRSFQGGIEHSEYNGVVSPAYIVLKPKKNINKGFYKYYFKSSNFIGHLSIAVIGIRDGRQVSYDDFCFVKIPFPCLEEQHTIAEILYAADKEIEKEKQKLEALKQQKKGLMQQLLTGKKRVMTK